MCVLAKHTFEQQRCSCETQCCIHPHTLHSKLWLSLTCLSLQQRDKAASYTLRPINTYRHCGPYCITYPASPACHLNYYSVEIITQLHWNLYQIGRVCVVLELDWVPVSPEYPATHLDHIRCKQLTPNQQSE